MLGLKLNHFSKRDPRRLTTDQYAQETNCPIAKMGPSFTDRIATSTNPIASHEPCQRGNTWHNDNTAHRGDDHDEHTQYGLNTIIGILYCLVLNIDGSVLAVSYKLSLRIIVNI